MTTNHCFVFFLFLAMEKLSRILDLLTYPASPNGSLPYPLDRRHRVRRQNDNGIYTHICRINVIIFSVAIWHREIVHDTQPSPRHPLYIYPCLTTRTYGPPYSMVMHSWDIPARLEPQNEGPAISNFQQILNIVLYFVYCACVKLIINNY